MKKPFYVIFETIEECNNRINTDSGFTLEYRQADEAVINIVGKIVWQRRGGK